MNKLLILGDIHGNWKNIRDIAVYYTSISQPLDETDTIIQLGDFSANFFLNERDQQFKKKLGKYKCNFFIIRGNHEERPSNLYKQNSDKWHTEEYFQGKVYVENDFPYIKYAMDTPSQYSINGYSILTLPGAYSVDKYYRLANGWSWFKDEQLTEDEMLIGQNLVLTNPNWDIVLSHTCPIIYEPTDLFLSNVDQSMVDKTMERFLGSIEQSINYKLWCFGHFHTTRVYPRINNSDRIMLFHDTVLDLNKYFNTLNPYNSLIKIKENK